MFRLVVLFSALLLIDASAAHADCKELLHSQDMQKLSYDVSEYAGDFNVSYDFPDLKTLDCVVGHFLDKSTELTFDLRNSQPIQVTISQNGRVTQHDTMVYLEISWSTEATAYRAVFGTPVNTRQGIATVAVDIQKGTPTDAQPGNFSGKPRNVTLQLR